SLARYSSARTPNVLAFAVSLATFSRRTCALGSIPAASAFLASSRLRRASAHETAGETPNVKSFSLPAQRNCIPQRPLPDGMSRRYSPPPSVSLTGRSPPLAERIIVSVKGMVMVPALVAPSRYHQRYRHF